MAAGRPGATREIRDRGSASIATAGAHEDAIRGGPMQACEAVRTSGPRAGTTGTWQRAKVKLHAPVHGFEVGYQLERERNREKA